jgi:hypothetical protein
MFTKPLTRQPLITTELSNEISVIRRMLTAAAISPRFCATLLDDPGQAIQKGFGGEQFHLSESTIIQLASIRAVTLPEFIQRLDECLSNHLLPADYSLKNL